MARRMIQGAARIGIIAALGLGGSGLAGCGDDEVRDESDGDAGQDADAGSEPEDSTYSLSFVLVPITAEDTSKRVGTPHRVVVLDGETGKPLKPRIEAMTAPKTGKVTIPDIPRGQLISLHVIGEGDPAEDTSSTYDTVVLNVNPDSGDPLLRISNATTYRIAETTAGFIADESRASVGFSIFWAPGGVRKGAVGCAQLCIDGAREPNEEMVQRYTGPAGLPVTLDKASETDLTGHAYLGNATVGEHEVAVSFDDCRTTVYKTSFVIPFARKDALGQVKSVIMQLGLDLDTKENPTPSGCGD